METHALDLGLATVRLLLTFTFVVHAAQKVLGWFSGAGLDASAAIFERLGQRPGRAMVLVAGASELGSAVLLALGLAWPLAVVGGAATMLVAGASVSLKNRAVWNAAGGGEYPFFIAAVLLASGLLGPGGWSLDELWDLPWHVSAHAVAIGLGTAVLAVMAAVPRVLSSRRHLRKDAAAS
jgi:putative oxidoreductase